jgi:N4-gp56 family major capsid protein
VVLRGKFAAQLLVSPPKAASSDPLAQRGTMGWKSYMTTILLNDLWMAVGETAVSA